MVKPPPQWSGDKTNQPATERYRLSLARAKFWRNIDGEPKTKRFRLVNNMSWRPFNPGVNSILMDAPCKCSTNKRNGQMYLSFIGLCPPKNHLFVCLCAFIFGLNYLCLTSMIGGASTKSH